MREEPNMNLLTNAQRDHAATIIGTRLITQQDVGLESVNERYHVAEALAEILERLPVEEYVLGADRGPGGKVVNHCADAYRFARSVASLAGAVLQLERRSSESYAGTCVAELFVRRPDLAEFEISASASLNAGDGCYYSVDVCNAFDAEGEDRELTDREVEAITGDNAYQLYRAICGTDEPAPGTTSIVVRREAVAQLLADAQQRYAGVSGSSFWAAFVADAQRDAQQQGNPERPCERG
jgi:hypothetical protein